jgi:hypothetical protein
MIKNRGCLLHRQIEEVSKIIFGIVTDFYKKVTHKALRTGLIVSHQTFGDMLRFNSHWHCIILEGEIDEEGSFHHILIKDTSKLAEVFRRRMIKLFVEKGLLQKSFAMKLISWKHSGFSVDNSISIPA